jgi:drug/metabolite transporter (DMT)-like permease
MNGNHWLRISYWVGALADACAAFVMLSQAIFAVGSPLSHYTPEVPYRYAMGLGGSLMVGWTVLLLWADRNPVERRGVLAITCVVVIGLIVCGLYALHSQFIPLSTMAPVVAFQVLLISIFAYSYWITRHHPLSSDLTSGQY